MVGFYNFYYSISRIFVSGLFLGNNCERYWVWEMESEAVNRHFPFIFKSEAIRRFVRDLAYKFIEMLIWFSFQKCFIGIQRHWQHYILKHFQQLPPILSELNVDSGAECHPEPCKYLKMHSEMFHFLNKKIQWYLNEKCKLNINSYEKGVCKKMVLNYRYFILFHSG